MIFPLISKYSWTKRTSWIKWTTGIRTTTSNTFVLSTSPSVFTYIARIFTANANPIRMGARPVFDFVSRATIKMTVTRTNVTIHSITIPYKTHSSYCFSFAVEYILAKSWHDQQPDSPRHLVRFHLPLHNELIRLHHLDKHYKRVREVTNVRSHQQQYLKETILGNKSSVKEKFYLPKVAWRQREQQALLAFLQQWELPVLQMDWDEHLRYAQN